jgi:hypothetical protein
MAEGIPARLTAAEGRRFGLTVGGAFLVLAAIAWWRGHPNTTTVFGVIGAALFLGGAIVPTSLGPIERAWMKLAHLISKVTTPIVMGVMYMVVLTPIGALRRAIGGNPLVHDASNMSYWKGRPEGHRAGNLNRQF